MSGSRPPACVCGERLLLIRPGRDTCERCRLGRTTTDLWLYEDHRAMLDAVERQRGERYVADVAVRLAAAGIRADVVELSDDDETVEECLSSVPVIAPPVQQPGPDVDVARWVWDRLASWYDK